METKCRNESIKNLKDAYVLKQFDSLSQLKQILDNIQDDINVPSEYVELEVKAAYNWRCDYLKSIGLSISKEEQALWDNLKCDIST